jgi:hypothetical protein
LEAGGLGPRIVHRTRGAMQVASTAKYYTYAILYAKDKTLVGVCTQY